MSFIHTIRVGEREYRLRDLLVIDDESDQPEVTWSARKLTDLLGDMEQALDGILAIQQSLTGGDGQ